MRLIFKSEENGCRLLFSSVYPLVRNYVLRFDVFGFTLRTERRLIFFFFFLFCSDFKHNLNLQQREENLLICLSFGAKSTDFVSSPALEDCWQLPNDWFSFQIHLNWFITVGQNSSESASFVPKQLRENMSKPATAASPSCVRQVGP